MITLTVPAEPEAMAVLRATAGAVAVRMDLTLDQVDDVRMAVEEAGALLIQGGHPITLTAGLAGSPLEMTVSTPTIVSAADRSESLAWMVLDAVADEVEVRHDDDSTALVLRFAPVGAAR